MATTKSRLNISLADDTRQAIARLASRDQVPDATLASRLIEIALELEEDQAWEELAAKRDSKKADFVPHEKVWQ